MGRPTTRLLTEQCKKAISLSVSPFIATLLVFISCFTGSVAMAGERSLAPFTPPHGPPLTYRIDAVNLRFTRYPGNSAFPIHRISLSGRGSATLERNGAPLHISYSNENLIVLLNTLYKIHFFELPAKYTTRYSVFLKDDGTVATSALRLSDAASTSVCFEVGEYEKCVTYGRDGPCELENLVDRVFDDLEKRVREK